MIARVRRWGNSLALRLRKIDVERIGVADGDLVKVEIVRVAKVEPLGFDLPTFDDSDPKASVRHDQYLYR